MVGRRCRFDAIDRRITAWMAAHGLTAPAHRARVVFLWFGALKLIPGVSPAETLAGRTIETLTFGDGPRVGGGAVPRALGGGHRPRACWSAAGCA